MKAGTRDQTISRAARMLDDGSFEAVLRRRVAQPTVSRIASHKPDLARYLTDDIGPELAALGFSNRLLTNDLAPGPFLLAERHEDDSLPTILHYGHGDVVPGVAEKWSPGLSPFEMTTRDGRWYGRGTADNKGQHSINIAALAAVLATRGSLGFNAKFLIEMGEEAGSVGLEECCAEHRAALAADLFIGSDGPRLSIDQPTIFLGARGGMSFELSIVARDGFHHSGNWGGLLSNPGIELCHAITALVGPKGKIAVPEMTPKGGIPANVRRVLAACHLAPDADDPKIDPEWGEPGLTPEEQVFAWSSFEVMEMECGNLAQPLYAIPPSARARVQLRFPVGVDHTAVVPAVRARLAEAGFVHVDVKEPSDAIFLASRLDPDDAWVRRVARSMEATLGRPPAIIPNIGGSLPNNIFCDLLGLPTIWIPHSYPGCRQHGPDEHVPLSIVREGLSIMAGLYWDLGEVA